MHTNSLDEAYAIPSEEAIKVAVRTQQILLEESGAADVVDPLARLVLRRVAHRPGRGARPRR